MRTSTHFTISVCFRVLPVAAFIFVANAAYAQSSPSEINDSVRLDKTNGTTISWDDLPGQYNVYRGSKVSSGPWLYNQACVFYALGSSPLADSIDPPPGRMFYYLVSRVNPPNESPIGRNSQGVEVPNAHACPAQPEDSDLDGIQDVLDNCPGIANANQLDMDGDGIGDVCDADLDSDGDGHLNGSDNCPSVANPNQQDTDGDSIGDACECLGVVCSAGSCQVAGTCISATGVCSAATPKANGTACNDGTACTQPDNCQGGVCIGANPVTCTASDQCHDAGTCAPATGICSNPAKANGAACDDGNASTLTDICSGGSCVQCVPNPSAVPPGRFVDNGNGTITDLKTCLVWEKKTGTVGAGVVCNTPANCPDPHAVNNRYAWSSSSNLPNGPAFTVFLVQLNNAGFAGHNDWRLPSEDGRKFPFTGPLELESILQGGQAPPTINREFGPTASSNYWSSTSWPDTGAYSVSFVLGTGAGIENNLVANYVRAVRGGP